MQIVFDSHLTWDEASEAYRFPAIVNHRIVQCVISKSAMINALEVPPEEVKFSQSFKEHRGVIRAVARRLIEVGRLEGGIVVIREEDFAHSNEH